MAAKTTLGDLRNGIEEIYRDIMREAGNGEAPNAVVLDRVRRDLGGEIRTLSSQLENIALVKLLNEVSNRKGRRVPGAALPDLFGDYGNIPSQITISRRIKKSTAELTIAEARLWLEAHTKKRDNPRHKAFRQMLDDLSSHQHAEEDTLATMLKRKRVSEQMELA